MKRTFSQMVADREPDAVARQSSVCPCCGSDKRAGLLLCPSCFSHETPTGLIPFAYADMPFGDWLAQAHAEQAARVV
jgi:hypothetical protein